MHRFIADLKPDAPHSSATQNKHWTSSRGVLNFQIQTFSRFPKKIYNFIWRNTAKCLWRSNFVDLELALHVTIFRNTATCIWGGGGAVDRSKHFGEPGCLRLQCTRGGQKFWVTQGRVFCDISCSVTNLKKLGPRLTGDWNSGRKWPTILAR